MLYYPEALYEEYEKEVERMIVRNEYTCQYPTKTTFYSENGQTTLIVEIGGYNEGYIYSDYTTATVKNFGTNEQEITFERSKKSYEQAYEKAEEYRTVMRINTVIFVFVLVIFIVYLIINSIKRHYGIVLTSMVFIIVLIAIIIAIMYFILV